jgi:hypothetical protein
MKLLSRECTDNGQLDAAIVSKGDESLRIKHDQITWEQTRCLPPSSRIADRLANRAREGLINSSRLCW